MRGRTDQQFRLLCDGQERLIGAVNFDAIKYRVRQNKGGEFGGLKMIALYTEDAFDAKKWSLHSICDCITGRWTTASEDQDIL